MKWFLVSIATEKTNLNMMNIKDTILKEFNIGVTETRGEAYNSKFAFASNRGIAPSKVDFDQIIVIGDIELHNKREITIKYNLDKTYLTDEDLITYLYKNKGIEFIKDLIGEFSFILYDRNQHRIYAVRDPLGIKSLYWMRYGDGFIFASDIFLLKSFFNIQNINNEYFREFYIRNGIIDLEITPFKDIFRIPSGSYLTSKEGRVRVYSYWDLSDIRETLSYRDESDYYEEFTEILQRAIKDRLIKGNGNSVMLSGGLDSTSVYALSKTIENKYNKLSVTPVSAVFHELKECNEQEYIDELLTKYNDKGIYINFDDLLMFENFPNNIPFSYEPSVNSISYEFTYNIVKKASEYGLTNILSGFAGDHLLTGSMYITRDLLKKGKIKEAFSYITNYSIATNSSAIDYLKKYTLFPNILVNHEIDKKSNYYKFMTKKLKRIKSFHQKELYYQITNAKAHIYSDRLIGAITGADMKHPFLDKRLVEYIYKIPGYYLFCNGISKHILRNAMKQYLPMSIVSRVNKTTHLAYTYKSIKRNWGYLYNFMNNPKHIVHLDLISESIWKEMVNKWRHGIEINVKFWVLLSIEQWFSLYFQKIKE